MSTTKQQSKNQQAASRKSLLYWIVGGVVGLGLIVALALSIAGEGAVDESVAFGEVTVEGEDLPFFQGPGSDPAVGMSAPTVTGHDWEGNEHTIAPDGRAKMVVMLAHWCPHCQAEVPVIQDWVEAGSLPEGVDLYGVTVLTNRLRDGDTWPPSAWLEEEGWTSPTIMDNEDGEVVQAYGLTSTPTYVLLGPDNENLGRFAGEVGVEGLNTLARIAADSLQG